MAQEAARLPPALREKLKDPDAEREFERSIEDRELLVAEARKRGLGSSPDLQRQIRELEERLLIQDLLADEEKARGAATDADARTYFEGHLSEFREPERIHLERILVTVPPAAGEGDRKKAQARASGYLARLRKGEPFAHVALEGDGAERARGGDAGWSTRPEMPDPILAEAAFGLPKPNVASSVISTHDGLAIVALLERRSAHEPSFDEVRSRVLNRLDPMRKRATYDALVAKLRRVDQVPVEVVSKP